MLPPLVLRPQGSVTAARRRERSSPRAKKEPWRQQREWQDPRFPARPIVIDRALSQGALDTAGPGGVRLPPVVVSHPVAEGRLAAQLSFAVRLAAESGPVARAPRRKSREPSYPLLSGWLPNPGQDAAEGDGLKHSASLSALKKGPEEAPSETQRSQRILLVKYYGFSEKQLIAEMKRLLRSGDAAMEIGDRNVMIDVCLRAIGCLAGPRSEAKAAVPGAGLTREEVAARLQSSLQAALRTMLLKLLSTEQGLDMTDPETQRLTAVPLARLRTLVQDRESAANLAGAREWAGLAQALGVAGCAKYGQASPVRREENLQAAWWRQGRRAGLETMETEQSHCGSAF